MAEGIFTIGHSTHSIGNLVDLLALYKVTAIADVRSYPYSRFNPQFNRESLRADLKASGISYVFLGRELGARTEDRSCYVEGRVQYDLLARTELFQSGLTRVAEGARRHRVALLCAEKDPLVCHRGILICRHLACRGISSEHILSNGQLESHDESLSRLLAEEGLMGDLFRTRDNLITEAYDRRGRQIAYTEKDAPEMPARRASG
jgi:uncharacterized protein (DUF488 family)